MPDQTFEVPSVTVRNVPMTGAARVALGDIKTLLCRLNDLVHSQRIDNLIDGLAALIAAYDDAYQPREWVA